MNIRFFVYIFLFIFSSFYFQTSFARDFYWASGTGEGLYQAATPLESCKLWHAASTKPFKQNDIRFDMASQQANQGFCKYTWYNGSIPQSESLAISRRGTGCTPPAVYNAEKGICETIEDKCASTAGIQKSHEHQTYPTLGGARVNPPGSICEGACQYAHNGGSASSCYRFVDGSKNGGFCTYTYQGNGVSCTSSPDPVTGTSVFDQPPTKPPSDVTPEYSKENQCGGWSTGADGTATRTCTGTETFTEPGKMSCDDTSAAAGCTAGTPKPSRNETTVTETTKTTTNPDGSTTTTTTKVTDKTTCQGTKPCTSDSKTETTTSGTNPDGTPGDESTVCTGTACNPEGDEEQSEEEEEGEERLADSGSCDGGFSCSGDAIDCEILKKQKEQLCLAEEQADFEGNKSEIEGLVQGEKFTVEEGEGDLDIPSFINQGTRFLSPSCPPDRVASFSFGPLPISFEPLCSFASALGPFLVVLCAIFCALYVGRSVGGQ